jgi:hypothetical protein
MWLLAPLVGFLVAVLFHAAVGRLPLIPNSVLRFLATGGLVGLVLLVLLATRDGLFSPAFATGILIYAFLSELYIFLFTFTLSSVSANLLARLQRRPLMPEEVAELYSGRNMTAARIARMVDSGFLASGQVGLELTAAGERTVRSYERLRRLFRHSDRSV